MHALTFSVHLIYNTAPGAYDVERVDKKVLQSSPAYSFGVKYKDQKTDDIPGNSFFHIIQLSLLLQLVMTNCSKVLHFLNVSHWKYISLVITMNKKYC